MSEADEDARRVKIVNAKWVAGGDGTDGSFQLMIVTSDDRQYFVTPSPAAMSALIALTQATTVLVWDPSDRTLFAANLRGTMPWTAETGTAEALQPSPAHQPVFSRLPGEPESTA